MEPSFLEMPYVQPFCSNKTLKHLYWKFQHKPTGNDNWVKGTIYYKIRYKVIFTGYFKSGHCQGTELAQFTERGKEYKLSNITKDFSADTIHHKTTLVNPIDFHDITVKNWNYRIFHPKQCIMYSKTNIDV